MDINATLLGQAITFALLVLFTMKFVWPPLTAALDERKQRIADGLAAGERGKQDLELASKRAADLLREAKVKTGEIIAQGEKRAAQIVEEAKVNAKQEGDRIILGAKAEIEQEVFRAKESLRNQVADLAVAGAEKILRREVDPKAHADLLSAIKQEL